MMRQINADEEEKVGRIQELMRGYADGVEANRKLLEVAASSVDGPDMSAFVQVIPTLTLLEHCNQPAGVNWQIPA